MLRTNLSSRPFYRERLVSLGLMAAAIGLVTLSVYNFSQVTTLSAEKAEHDRNIALNRDEAARIRADIQRAVSGVDMNQLQQLVAATAEANALITARTFSWSQFFDIVEKAMPYEVRLVGVAHRVEDGERVLVLNVIAQEDDQLNEFVRGMLETGAFFDVLPVEKARNEDGTVSAIVETYYLAPAVSDGATTSTGTGASR